MQVDQQPSPWPCVAMLVGLLLFCLAAPFYWQHDLVPATLAGDDKPRSHSPAEPNGFAPPSQVCRGALG